MLAECSTAVVMICRRLGWVSRVGWVGLGGGAGEGKERGDVSIPDGVELQRRAEEEFGITLDPTVSE